MQQTLASGHRLSFGSAAQAAAGLSHELRFASLFDPGRALAFPCTHCGEVQLDRLSERARNNYFFARATVGRDYGLPTVVAHEAVSIH